MEALEGAEGTGHPCLPSLQALGDTAGPALSPLVSPLPVDDPTSDPCPGSLQFACLAQGLTLRDPSRDSPSPLLF